VFGLNKKSADYIPRHQFYDTKFTNIEEDAMAYFYDPPKGWANLKDCGEFPCTGPENLLYTFDRTTYEGIK
jgi:hypothetical protein